MDTTKPIFHISHTAGSKTNRVVVWQWNPGTHDWIVVDGDQHASLDVFAERYQPAAITRGPAAPNYVPTRLRYQTLRMRTHKGLALLLADPVPTAE